MPGNDLSKIRVDPTLKVDPVATLGVYYSRLMDDVWRRLQGAKGKPPAHLIAQAHAIASAMERVDARAASVMRAALSRQYSASSLAAQKTVELAGVPVLHTGFGDFDRRAARALVERTTSNLGAIRESLFRGLVLADPSSKATVQAIESALAGDNQLVSLDDGRVSVKVPSGRFWSPPAYARMIGRTAIADARRVAFRHRYLANDIDLVEIVANGSDHEECLAWEGVVVSLTGRTPGYPTMDEARADGLFHPNCRHRYVAALGVEQPEIPLGDVDVPDEGPSFTTLGQAQGVTSRAPAPTPKSPPRAPRAPRASRAPRKSRAPKA